MKKRFTRILAAFALLVFMMPSLVAWGQTRATVTDVMNQSWTGVTGSSYTDFSNKAGSASNAVYAGNCAGSNSSIQLRSKNSNSGIVSTTSGGTVTKVTVTWNSNTQNGRTLNVYGSNTAYSGASDLYSSTTQGTLLGTIVCGTSTELTVSESFAYIGMRSASDAMYLTTINVEWETSGSTPTCATPTFSLEAGTYTGAKTVTISCETEDATIYYTTDGQDPTTSSTVYSGDIIVSTNTTIKAMAVAEGYNNSAIATAAYIIIEHAGTEADPYTVADARTAIDANVGTQDVYVSGIVTRRYNNTVSNGKLSYYISDDGTQTNELEAYKGLYLNGAEFTSYEQIQAGDVVVIYGDLTKFNSTYELAEGNYLVSHTPGTTPSISANNVTLAYDATSGEIDYTITNPASGVTLTATTTASWISNINVNATSSKVTFTTTANEGTEDRTATVTLSYTGATDKTVTVTQKHYVADYATLPFEFDGNATAVDNTDGLTQNGLDSYNSSPKLQFNTTGDWLILHFNERPGTLSFNIKGNGFSGGTFTVQTSEDGTNYSDLTTYTELSGTAQTEEFNNLGENVRYIKWIYTNKSSGNVALGNIALAKYVAPQPSITVTPLEINVDAEYHQDDLTVTYTNVDPYSNISVAIFYDAEGHETDCSWLWVELKSDKNFRYTIFANEGGARTAYFKIRCNGVYSDMVTVNQAAYVAPPTPGNWVLTDLADLTADDIFVIVGDNFDTYAMSNDNGTTNPPAAVAVTVVEGTLSEEPADNLQWNLGITDDGYIFYPNGTMESWLYCTNTNNGVRVGTNTNNVFVLTDGYLYNDATSRYMGIYNSQDWRCYTSINSNIEGQTFAFYKKVEEESYTLEITGYTNDNEKTGYYLIASPVFVDPYLVGMADGDFDLYSFDQSEEEEWRNYEAGSFTMLEPGKGYLYAKKATDNVQTYYFNLSGTPYVGDGIIDLTYDASEGVDFPGLNLIGNPFGEEATLNLPFYRMNLAGSGFEAVEETGSTVNAKEGVFVYAEYEDGYVTNYAQFTPNGNTSGGGGMKINLTRNRGTVIDNAIVRFDNGRQLPKFQLFENSTKLYIPQGNKDYAIVRSAAEAEMPVSFRASENGTYTLAIEAENVEMNYLHLIDNLTGMDVDLLQTPSYTFEAKTSDYASRFRLVFKANGTNENNAETFAYFNGTNWTVSNVGDATLQVVDVTGRTVSSETINGNATISLNQTPGVYMLRLVNGNSVKVQKVVVR